MRIIISFSVRFALGEVANRILGDSSGLMCSKLSINIRALIKLATICVHMASFQIVINTHSPKLFISAVSMKESVAQQSVGGDPH